MARVIIALMTVLAASSTFAQDPWFDAKVDYVSGGDCLSVCSADFDGDGDYDIAAANAQLNNVSVLMNAGIGTLGSPEYFPVGSYPHFLTTADIDRDGDSDLIVANALSGTVRILQNNGAGSFQLLADLTVGSNPRSIHVCDLDNDGDRDLAVANLDSDNLSILKSNGDGTFQSAVHYGSGDWISVSAGDVDHDGDVDLALASVNPARASVLRNAGDGTFYPAINYVLPNGPYSISVKDIDGDSYDDLVLANGSPNSLSVFWNNGDGTFEDAVHFAAGHGPVSAFASDLDSDGHDDLVAANLNSSAISVLRGHGDRTFESAVNFSTGSGPFCVVGSDLNGDGDIDLVSANRTSNNVSVLMNLSAHIPVTIRVPADQPTIQAGIDAADAGDTVLVADGTYTGLGNRDIELRGKTIVLKSQNGPISTIIDCQGSMGNDHRGIFVHEMETRETLIEGFTITGGWSYMWEEGGMGILILDASPTIRNCVVTGNTFTNTTDEMWGGGGIAVVGQSSPLFEDCEVSDNHSGEVSGAFVGYNSGLVMMRCTFKGNEGACSFEVRGTASALLIQDCVIRGNSGNGINLLGASDVTLSHCMVADNGGSGCVVASLPSAAIENCTVADNSGDGVRVESGATALLAASVVSANRQRALYCEESSQSFLTCSDLFGNIGGDWVGCIADQYGQNGNISIDPLFCDPANGDYHLYDFSPCAAANNSCGQLIGAYDVACSLGASLTLPSDPDAQHVVGATPTVAWAFIPAPGWLQSDFEIAVGTDNDWSYAEMWNPAPFQSADQSVVYAGAVLLDGVTYYARVRSKLNGSWTPWYETSFRMNSLPSRPVASSPVNGAIVPAEPSLFVTNSFDPEADPLSYRFLLYESPGDPTPLIASDLIPQADDSTGWTVPEYLSEDSIYAWRCVAFDGYEYSDTSAWYFFAVNSLPEAPTTPEIVSPVGENLILYDMLPTLVWTGAVDPDPFDEVRYRLELSLNQAFTMVVPFDDLEDTAFQFADSLSFDTRYWWRVKAQDEGGLFSTSAPSDFWTWTLGDVNRTHDCTIGDVSILIDHLFISNTPIVPAKTGDVNASCDITIGDVSLMIDRLFISGAEFKAGCE